MDTMDTFESENRKQWNPLVPARYVMTFMLFVGMTLIYSHRVNLNIAIVDMVKVHKDAEVHEISGEGTICLELMEEHNRTSHKTEEGEFDWDSRLQGQVLGSMFYGMFITPIPLSILGTYVRMWKWMLGIAGLVVAIMAFLIPVAAHMHVGMLIADRVVQGLAIGIVIPAIQNLVGNWAPKTERSILSGHAMNGISVGTICTYAISGPLIHSRIMGGWPSVFYVTGICTVLWFILYCFLVYENPHVHPNITPEELDYIGKTQDHNPDATIKRIPWKDILSSTPLWALAFTHFCNNWGFFTLLIQTPTYLAHVLFFHIVENGLLSALPYIVGIAGTLCGSYLADFLRERETFSITVIRKIMTSIAFYVPAIMLITIPLMGCRPNYIVALLCVSNAFASFKFSGFLVTHVDMSPSFTGLIHGITATFGNMAGFLAPSFAGWAFRGGHTLENWRIVFLTAAVVNIVGGTVFNLFADANPQHWGEAREDVDAEDQK